MTRPYRPLTTAQWKAMTPTDISELKAAAEKATDFGWMYDNDYLDKVAPAVVLSLIAIAEGAAEERGRLRKELAGVQQMVLYQYGHFHALRAELEKQGGRDAPKD